MITQVDVDEGIYSPDDISDLLEYIATLESEIEELTFKVENP